MGPEAKVEAFLVKEVKLQGGLCVKNKGTRGFPDRTVILNGATVFVEVKAEGEEPRPEQIRVFKQIISQGGVVFVIDSKEQVIEFMVFMMSDYEEEESVIVLPGNMVH